MEGHFLLLTVFDFDDLPVLRPKDVVNWATIQANEFNKSSNILTTKKSLKFLPNLRYGRLKSGILVVSLPRQNVQPASTFEGNDRNR
jgi:hypothetical protein